MTDRTHLTPHPRYADYGTTTMADLVIGDGVRLLPLPGKPVPAKLYRPLVVTDASCMGDLVSITVVDRSSLVSTILGDLPEGACEAVETLVYSSGDPVLVRL